MNEEAYPVRPVAFVRSPIASRQQAPLQGDEGGADAWIEVGEAVREGLDGIAVGHEMILLTWLHQARRDVLKLHPRDDPARPLTGVFATRSPDRPNPIGLHRVRVLAVESGRILVSPLEVFDGTPVLDIKPVLDAADR